MFCGIIVPLYLDRCGKIGGCSFNGLAIFQRIDCLYEMYRLIIGQLISDQTATHIWFKLCIQNSLGLDGHFFYIVLLARNKQYHQKEYKAKVFHYTLCLIYDSDTITNQDSEPDWGSDSIYCCLME